MPWNFPLWQVVRFAAAALMGGNAVIVKHSPLVPRCAAAIEDLFAVAGFGPGVFRCESGSSKIAEKLIADDRIRAVAFTGGCDTARSVAALAGRHLKKIILELGGSDAFVVMPSADVAAAAHAGVQSRIRASGQACTAAKRFIVDAAIAGEFEDIFVSEMNALRTGDALDPRSDVGPLITEAAACVLERQVRESIAAGAKLLCGGVRLGPRLYQPTALAVRTVDVSVMQEETFGPVAAILRVRHIDEAIAAANATRYGLSASVWTSDEREIAAFRSRLDVGQLFVNTAASSRVDLPFGGTKDSGYGRELGDAGVYEFVNVKTEVRERC
jgi:succinate-semialdehyde dehydrogenase/glutarate-semialdehyde dehydrogenase